MNVSLYGAPAVVSAIVVFNASTFALMFPNADVATSVNVKFRVDASSYSSVNVAVFVVANYITPLDGNFVYVEYVFPWYFFALWVIVNCVPVRAF